MGQIHVILSHKSMMIEMIFRSGSHGGFVVASFFTIRLDLVEEVHEEHGDSTQDSPEEMAYPDDSCKVSTDCRSSKSQSQVLKQFLNALQLILVSIFILQGDEAVFYFRRHDARVEILAQLGGESAWDAVVLAEQLDAIFLGENGICLDGLDP